MNRTRDPRRRHINLPVFIPELACPQRCIYCNQSRITGQPDVPSPAQARRTIAQYMESAPLDAEIEIAFFGGTFTALPFAMQRMYLEAAAPFVRSGAASGVRISTRPDYINDEIINLLQEYGITTIELGIQSFDNEVLARCRRGYDSGTAVQACRLIKARQVRLSVQLMIGLPGDSRSACLESARLTAELGADMVRIYPTLVLQDTELAAMVGEGAYEPLPLAAAVELAAEMLLYFENSGIDVIRIGLQASADLQPGQSILAGPYHPAFGELVEQHIYYQMACRLLQSRSISPSLEQPVILMVPAGHRSKMIGQHRSNVLSLAEEFGLPHLEVRESAQNSHARRVELITDP